MEEKKQVKFVCSWCETEQGTIDKPYMCWHCGFTKIETEHPFKDAQKLSDLVCDLEN